MLKTARTLFRFGVSRGRTDGPCRVGRVLAAVLLLAGRAGGHDGIGRLPGAHALEGDAQVPRGRHREQPVEPAGGVGLRRYVRRGAFLARRRRDQPEREAVRTLQPQCRVELVFGAPHGPIFGGRVQVLTEPDLPRQAANLAPLAVVRVELGFALAGFLDLADYRGPVPDLESLVFGLKRLGLGLDLGP